MRFREFKIVLEDDAKAKAVEPTASHDFEVSLPSNKYISVDIADIQKALSALGYGELLGTAGPNKDGIDGIRGPYTRRAIQAFQKDHNLTVDGDPGKETVAELNQVLAKKSDLHLTKSTEYNISRTAQNVLNKNKVTDVTDQDVSDIDDTEFTDKLKLIAQKLGVSYNDLYAVIKAETKGTFNPASIFKSKDSKFRAGGLIGFTEETAHALGTTLDELLAMTSVDQLDYVYKFYKKLKVKPGMDRGDLYMLQFMPAYLSLIHI